MEQYKPQEGRADTPAHPVRVSEETKQIQSAEKLIRQLQENFNIQQQEIARLHRDINRLKNQIDDVITMVRNRE